MKTYNSTTEGVWVEILSVQITEEEIAIMNGSDDNAKKQVIADINARKQGDVSTEKAEALTSIYDGIKSFLQLKETDVYELIGADVSELDDLSRRGIVNYNVNGVQKQFRF